ncbi:unnamed protein product, partial [Brenthis ino]
MEGGDGVVAIVRGCRHAKLAVTLLPGAYFKLNRRQCADIGPTRVCQSSVETNTTRMLQQVSQYDVSYKQCPIVTSRYVHHKRHGKCLKSSPTESVPCEIKTLRHTVSSNIVKLQSKQKSCFCHQPLTCDCKRKEHDPINNIFTNSFPESDQRKEFNQPEKQTILEVRTPREFTKFDNDIENEEIFKEINRWMKEIPVYPNFNETDKLKQDAVIITLAKTLKYLLNQTDFIPKAKPEIVKCLNALPIWRPNEQTDEANFIDDLVNKLSKRFINLAENNFIDCITKQVQDLPFKDDNSINNTHIQNTIDQFINKLKPLALNRSTDDVTYKKKLKLKLNDLLNDLNLKIDKSEIESIDILADNLADQLCHMHLYNSTSNEREFKNNANVVQEKILAWCQNLSEFTNKDIHQCADLTHLLTNKLQKYNSLNFNVKENRKKIQDDIEKWLSLIADRLQISFSVKRKNELSKELMMQILELHDIDNKKYEDGISDISFGTFMEWLLNIPGLSEENIMESKKMIENLANSLKEIQIRDNNSENRLSDTKKMITNWLQHFLRQKNEHIDPSAHDNLVKRLTSKSDNMTEPMPKLRKRWDDLNRSNFAKIKEAVGTIENNDNMEINKTFSINLSSKSTQTMHESENKTNDYQNSKKKYEYQEITENFSQSNQSHMSQNETYDNNTFDFTGAKTRKEFLGPRPLNASSKYTTNNEDKMTTTTIEEYHSESSSILRNINATSKKILDKEFGNFKSYKESDNKSKISTPNTYKDNSMQTSTFHEKLVLEDNFTTSTPLASSLKNSTPHSKMTSIDDILINKKESRNKELSDNTQYLHRLESAIDDWLKTLDLDVKDLEKHNLAESIASDFLDRKKYLKLSGTKTSEIHELEQLKYQIYRRLYNFTNSETIPVVIAKVNDLYRYLIRLSKPQTNKSNEISNTLDTESFTDLKSKIKSWLNLIPSQLYLSNDKNNKENLIKNLTTKVHSLMRSGNYEDNIKSEFLMWLPKLLKVWNINELNDLAENLKSHIETDYNIEAQNDILNQHTENNNLINTQIPTQNTSEFIVENLRGVAVEWFRKVRPFPRNMMTNISLVDNFTSALANDLKKVFENNSNIWSLEFEDLLVKEIVKNIKNVLCDHESDSLYQRLANDFITYLKQIRLFHDISDRIPINTTNVDESKYENEIRKAVTIWSKNLILQSEISFKDIEQILNNFIDILSTYMIKDINSIENRLREDTLKILKNIPLKIHHLRYDELQEHIESLINIMRTHIVSKENIDFISMTIEKNTDLGDNVNLQPTRDTRISNVDDIHTIIKNWCDNIPLYVEHSDGDRVKLKEMRQNIASQIINFFDNLNTKQIYSKDDFYELLRYEIQKLLKNMPMTHELENCLNILIDVVIEKLKDVTHDYVNQEKKESVTSTYKLLLHQAINKTLSLIDNPTIDEQISFNLLKEKLANAFIELHHPTDDVEIRNKYKDKLCYEIDKFCKDFLNQSIFIPVNSEKIKNDLDKALKNVSVPKVDLQDAYDSATDNVSPKISLKIDASNQFNLNVPPSTLSVKELDHTQRIRARSNIRIESPKIFRKDISTSPLPMDMATQTEVNIAEEINQTSNNMVLERPSLRKEVSPQVLIKEFYWDSSGSKQSLRMFSPSEISQRIEPRPTNTAKSQTNEITNKTIINSIQSSKILQTHEDTSKREIPRTEAIPKHTINSFQQTSSTLIHPIVSYPKSNVEDNKKELEEPYYSVKDINQNHERREVRSDPISFRRIFQKAQRTGEGSEETEGDIHIRRSVRRKDIYDDLSKRIPEDRQIDAQQYHKDDRRCSCKDNILTKCRKRMYFDCRQPNLRHCAKGFGCFCPHPSNFFFKRDF